VSFERYSDKIVAAHTRALTEALQTVINEFNTKVQTTAGLPMIEQSITEMTRQIQQGVQANQAALGSILSASAESMQSYNQQLTSLLSKTIETAKRDLGSHLRRAAEDAGKHVVALDRALEEELTRSIESLGRQLTALSQKFVQDYTPLTVSLQRLLQGARA
jgi:F0F1-type ATP synthase membrane subunit b/b'